MPTLYSPSGPLCPLRTHPLASHARGAANWEPLSPAPVLKQTPGVSVASSSGADDAAPEAPGTPSGNQAAPGAGDGEPQTLGMQPPPSQTHSRLCSRRRLAASGSARRSPGWGQLSRWGTHQRLLSGTDPPRRPGSLPDGTPPDGRAGPEPGLGLPLPAGCGVGTSHVPTPGHSDPPSLSPAPQSLLHLDPWGQPDLPPPCTPTMSA